MWTRRRVNMNISGKKTPQIDGTNNCDNFIIQGCIQQSINLFFSSWDSGNNMLVVAQPFDYEDVASYPDFPNVTICK